MNILSIVGILFVLAFNFEFLSESAREVPVFMVEVFPSLTEEMAGYMAIVMAAVAFIGVVTIPLMKIISSGNDALEQRVILSEAKGSGND